MFLSDFTYLLCLLLKTAGIYENSEKQNLSNIQYKLLNVSTDQATENNYLI